MTHRHRAVIFNCRNKFNRRDFGLCCAQCTDISNKEPNQKGGSEPTTSHRGTLDEK